MPTPAAKNPLLDVLALGQSLWYDNIRRGLITSGELSGLIDKDGLRGVTSNPSIFEKAIAGSTDYNDALLALEKEKDQDAKAIYERLAIKDIQDAAGIMLPVYQ
jgi:transaldolase/glucose-6-phosphate isomerase